MTVEQTDDGFSLKADKGHDRIWVGADPGGEGNFGIAILNMRGDLKCFTISSVDEANERLQDSGEILGIGIDAPMWWSSRRKAARIADQNIRLAFGISHKTVQWANSLRGAAIVGGAMLAYRLRELDRNVKITESHPKAILLALEINGSGFAKKFEIPESWDNEHERDATIAAVCAREGFQGRWQTDLALQRHKTEQDTQSYWLAPMHYFWPKPIPCREQC